jgi:hypothetical protein
MGGAKGLGDAESPTTAEHETPASIKIDKMARGDIDGLHPGPCAQRHSHPFAPVGEAAIPAPRRPRLPMRPDKPRLGAADRRQVKPEPQVAGEAETPGMSEALAVAENNLRLISKPPESAQEQGNFAKGEEPRDVGKGDVTLHLGELHKFEPRKGVDGDRSRHSVAVSPIAHVGAGNQVDSLGKGPQEHTGGKAILEGYSLLRGEIPGVEHGITTGQGPVGPFEVGGSLRLRLEAAVTI